MPYRTQPSQERIFLAAFSSLSKVHTHLQACDRLDSVFFTIAPQLEHSKAGVLGIHRNRYFLKYFAKVFKPDTKLIPRCVINRLGQTMIFTIFFILKSTQALKSLDADYAPCKFHCMVQYDCLLILRWRKPRICLARAPVL